MKKAFFFLILISVIFVTGCNNNYDDTEYQRDINVRYNADYLSSEYYIFDHAENIVKAKLIDVGSWGGAAVFEYRVLEEYYGEVAEHIIYVYGGDADKYKVGKKYYLFLKDNGYSDDGEHIMYKNVSVHAVFPANKKEYEYGYGEKWYTLNRSCISEMIEEAKVTREEREIAEWQELFVSENICASDAAKEADIIAVITIERRIENDKLYVHAYEIAAEELFKGSKDHIAPVIEYAEELKTGANYILMLKYNEKMFSYELFDKNYSLMPVEEAEDGLLSYARCV